MNTLALLNISIQSWGVIFCMMALWGMYTVLDVDKRNVKGLFALVSVNILLLISDSCAWIFDGRVSNPGMVVVRVSNFLVFFCNNVMLGLVTRYLYERMEEHCDRLTGYLEKTVYVISAVGILLLILSQKLHIVYGIDADNVYYRGPFFWVTQVISVVGFVLLLIIVVRNKKQFVKGEYTVFLLFFTLLSASLVVQIFFYGISLLNFIETVGVLFVVVFNLIERAQEGHRQKILLQQQQLEIERQAWELERATQKLRENQTEILVSQIQPHFIFNSLLVIRSLCQEDVDKAIDAINHFSKYLRICLDSLNSEKMIPLQRELELSECYLYMEKLRFESAVTFHKSIETTGFCLPALTIQPILENAVKHGLRKVNRNGSIWLTVRDEQDDHVIVIKDNGVGFDQSEQKQDGRTHVGIQNVALRLQYLCQGMLHIESQPGEGTEVTIRIPREITKDELPDR